jgi:hypothetical protein
MIWADRVGLVLAVPVILFALLQGPGGVPHWSAFAIVAAIIWGLLRGLDFIFTGGVRRRYRSL